MEGVGVALFEIQTTMAQIAAGVLPDEDGLRKIVDITREVQFDEEYAAQVMEYNPTEVPLETVGEFPAGIHELDLYLNGGLVRGEIAYVSGGSGAGKTTFLISRGAEILRNLPDTTVTHCTIEIYPPTVAQRYTENLLRKPLSVLDKETLEELAGRLKSRLFIADLVDCPRLSEVERVVERTNPDLLIVDYGDLLIGRGESRFVDLGQIWQGLRTIAKRHHCVVWTASRVNRDGSDGESYLKGYNTDLHVVLESESEDMERGMCHLFIKKIRRREGNQRRFRLIYQPENAYIGG
jgi:predicted ATP-dependent serine protease